MSLRALEPVHFPWFDYSRYTFSLGLEREGAVWLSGHSASEYDSDARRIVIKGGMAEQTRTAYSKIEAILASAGMDWSNLHRVVEYVTAAGIEHYAEAEGVRAEILGEVRPAVCTVLVNRLLRDKALIEIEVAAGDPGAPSGEAGGRPARSEAVAAGDLVFLSSLLAIDEHDQVVAEGDLVGQTEYVFEKASRLLGSAGLDLSNVVKTVDYTTPATLDSYKASGRVRKQVLGPVYPAAAGILAPRLSHVGALVSLDVIASRLPLEAINPGWARYEKLTYSPAVKAGNVLFMSGQAALDPATERAVHGGDVVAQAEYTYSNILEVLAAAGAGPENLVKTIEYVTPAGLPRYREVASIRERLLREPYPASTGAVCPALLRPEFEIEIDPLAVI